MNPHLTRRDVLLAGIAGTLAPSAAATAAESKTQLLTEPPGDTYETHARGVRILPGRWRPHYPWEQIAWISPPWASQDYLWFDFPEAIFTRQGMLFLSHANPTVEPPRFPDIEAVPWVTTPTGLRYERRLPNGFRWIGELKRSRSHVDYYLEFINDSDEAYSEIRLQTCLMLRAAQEFGPYRPDNKFVHVRDRGWMPFEEARKLEPPLGKYRLGWRGGPEISDLPVIITKSEEPNRMVAMTWFDSTYSLMQNPPRPCMHADPFVPDLPPGKRATIPGRIWFFEGSIEDFEKVIRRDLDAHRA